MLNAKKIKATGGSRVAQENIEPGNYNARVVQVIDLGLQDISSKAYGEKPPANQLWVTFELSNEFMVDEKGLPDAEKPRWLSRRINLFSMSAEMATSTKWMDAIDPKGSLEGDWGRVLGMPCTLTVINKESGGKVYDNIGAVSPVMRGMVVPELVNDPVMFDISMPDMDVYNSLPDFLKDIIKGNLEFQGSALDVALSGGTPSVDDEIDDDDIPY